MTYSVNTYTVVAGEDEYNLNFSGDDPGYIEEEHVIYYIGEVAQNNTDRTFVAGHDGMRVKISPIPVDGTEISFRRETSPTEALIDWVAGAGVLEVDLDTNTLQMLYLAQESDDRGSIDTAIVEAAEAKAEQWAEEPENSEVETGKYSALHHAAKAEDHAATSASHANSAYNYSGLASTSATQAANYASLADADRISAAASAVNADEAKTAAVDAAESAGISANAASSSASAAGISEGNAAGSAIAADNYATAAFDSATDAETAQTAAELAETNANTSASNAASSEEFAAASAAEAAASAASINVGNDIGDLTPLIDVGGAAGFSALKGDNLTGVMHDLTDDLSPALSGPLTCLDNRVTAPAFKDSAEITQVLGTITSSTTISLESGNVVTATIGAAITFTFSNPPQSGRTGFLLLELTNGGAYTVTFPGSVIWDNGVPTLQASGTDTLLFYTIDEGTTWRGKHVWRGV